MGAEEFNITGFRSSLSGGGARPNLFQVDIPLPAFPPSPGAGAAGGPAADRAMSLMTKGASIPDATIGMVPVPFMGRQIKVPGNRTYAEWTTTAMVSEGYEAWDAIRKWIDLLNGPVSNLSLAADPTKTIGVTQYSRTGAPNVKVQMMNAWPSNLGAIELGWENNDSIAEFSITWQYDYWTVDGTVGNAVSKGLNVAGAARTIVDAVTT